MEISDDHRRFLRIDQCLVPGIINIVINGGIAWALLRAHAEIPLWGSPSVGIDLIATGFLLPFFTCMIVSRIVGGQVRSGKLSPIAADQIGSRGFHHQSILKRALFLGVACVVFTSAPLVAALEMANAQPIAFYSFVGFKAIWGGLLAVLLTPLIAWWALSSASMSQPVAEA
jgi:hypothetical protein